jgi:transposase
MASFEVQFARVCGLDVHRDTIAAALRTPGPGRERLEVIQTFGTMTADLLALRQWLEENEVTHVAMEATGVLWKPVYYALEDRFNVLLANPAHIKNVPGRKTDVKDSSWIARLLECGLLTASFVPPKPIRELRDLTRYRTELVQERTRQAQRLHKVLQDAGVKLSSVASNILGQSGRAMIEALIGGTRDANALAELARGVLRKKLPELRRALESRFDVHHAFMASRLLGHIDFLEEEIGELTRQIEEVLRPFASEVERLSTIPGVRAKTASVIVAEIGVDMKQFPTAKHLASWAGLCPGNNESAGKHKRCGTRSGDKWLRAALVESALAALKKKDNRLAGLYRRLRSRMGHKKAIVAVAHEILTIAYYVLARGKTYEELGPDYFDRAHKEAAKARYVRKLQRMGFDVQLVAKEGVA